MAPEVDDKAISYVEPSPPSTTTLRSSLFGSLPLAISTSKASRIPCAPAGAEPMVVYNHDPLNEV